MLYFEESELEAVASDLNTKCENCGDRRGTWRGTMQGSPEKGPVLMCGWCCMYGCSVWAYERRDEIAHVGPLAAETAMRKKGKSTNVPKLDEMGRFADPVDAERFMLGVAFTSRLLRGRLKGTLLRGSDD